MIDPPSKPAAAGHGLAYILSVTSFALTAGALFGAMGLIVLPAEVLLLWPETQAASLGLLMTTVGLTQLIAPVAGYYSDRCTHWLGRRRPLILGGGALVLLGLGLMRIAHDSLLGWLFAVGVFTLSLGLNIAFCGHSGLLPDLLPGKVMGKASGQVAVFNALGALVSFWYLGFGGLQIRDSYAFFAATTVFTVGLTCLVARETPQEKAPAARLSELAASFRISEASHKDFYWVFWIRMLYYMGISVLSFIMLYLRDVTLPQADDHYAPFVAGLPTAPIEQAKAYAALVAVVGQLGAVIIAVPVGQLSDRFGRKPFLYAACAFMVSSYMGFLSAPPPARTLFFAFVFGWGNGAFLAVDYALAVDTLPNKANAAKDLGLWGVAAFIGASFGPVLLGILLHVVGLLSIGGTVDDLLGGTLIEHYGLRGYEALMVCGSIFVISATAMLRKVSKR